MSNFIEVIMNNFSKINKHILLDLNISVFVNLYSWSVYDTHVSDKIFAIFTDNHKLRFPKFFIIWNLVMISITFSNFVNSWASIESNLKVFYLLSVNSFKHQIQFMSCSFIWNAIEWSSLQIRGRTCFKFFNLKFRKNFVGWKCVETRLKLQIKSSWQNLDIVGSLKFTRVSFNLIEKWIEGFRLAFIYKF